VDFKSLKDTVSGTSSHGGIRDQRVWGMAECAEHFKNAVNTLKHDLQKQGDGGMLVWDKDDEAAMDFVTAAANIRAHVFHIPTKSRFDIKSMAGNIIPAIATTNAIIAALIVMEGIKILKGEYDQCKTVYLNRQPNPRKKLLVPCVLDKPNPKCYVCAEKPEVGVRLNTTSITVKTLEDKILKAALGMVAPDVEIDDGKGTILISSEEGETEDNANKMLSEFGIQNGTRLKCDDFLQVYEVVVNIAHVEQLDDEKEFEVIGDVEKMQAMADEETKKEAAADAEKPDSTTAAQDDDDEELMVVEEPEETTDVARKRKGSTEEGPLQKRQRVEEGEGDSCDIVIL